MIHLIIVGILFLNTVLSKRTKMSAKEIWGVMKKADESIEATDKFINEFWKDINQRNIKRKVKDIKSYQDRNKERKSKEKSTIVQLNKRITEFPYFTPILNVSLFTRKLDFCNKKAPITGYYIPVIIPPNKMLRVSTCNHDTNVKTSITLMYNQECLQTTTRNCRRWKGSIIEYIPKGNKPINALIRVGANLIKKGTVRITVYTIPITLKNKAKLQHGKIASGNGKQIHLISNVNKTEILPLIHSSNKSHLNSPNHLEINNNSFNLKKSVRLNSSFNQSSIEKINKQLEKFTVGFKIFIGMFIGIAVVIVAIIVIGSFIKSKNDHFQSH
ncbi:hypothetical protein CL6EHI_180340 [Entamoeba histolytica]|nr:hypothetical protein CL6EHI_180340 [Entamoeba histolytica]